MARLSFRCDDELLRRVDKARGLVARETWLRAVVEAATFGPVARREPPEPYVFEAERQAVREAVEAGATKARVVMGSALPEQPDTRALDLLREDDPDPDFVARGRIPELPPPDPDRRRPLARSSSQAKRDVRPVPKAKS